VNKNLDLVISDVVANLPDSVEERQALLKALIAVVPRQHPSRPGLASMAKMLEQHLAIQQEFPFQSNQEGNGNEKP
jgi:hypothetical protein